MWFGKSIMTKLGLALALAVPSFAADLKPFNFAGVASTSQQDYWEELMKYKVFGEQGILFVGQNIRVTDTVGWFGTAKGPFDMSNGNGHHVVGGPIIIGGDLKLSNGNDSLFTGPVRVNGNVRLGYDTWSNPNFVRGDQCIGGAVTLDKNGNTLVTYDANHNRVDIYDTAVKMGSLYKGSNYNSCPKSVPKYYEDLTIPHPGSVSHTEHAAISIDNKIAYIDVPKGTGQYDYYVKGLSFANQSVLVVRMPKGGRLTRVFVNGNINFGTAHPKVRIVYMDDDVEWVGDDDTGHWNANGGYDGDKDVELEHNGKTEKVSTSVWHVDHSTNVENKDYVGNLLVYSTGKISWGAVTAADSMIGSYIAADSITIEQHMTLAGQLLGKYVRINADFDGSFQFMPYDNPKVKLPKAADDSEYLIEGIPNTIKIQLDKASKLPIDFKYCFEFEGAENDLTSGLASRADIEDSDIPLYNSSTKTCSTSKPGRFEAGETSMRNPITLTALKDNYSPEGKGTDRLETFKIWITGLTGATLEDGSSHDGFIVLTIKDVGGPQFNDDVKNYYVEENKKKGFVFDSIPIKNVKVDVADADKFTLEITGSDATLAKTLFNFELIPVARKDADVYDTAYIKMSVKTDDLNYEALSQTSFELKFRLKNDGTATDSTVRTINVIDINEAPKITSVEDMNKDYSGSPTPYILYPKETLKGGDSVGVVWVDDPDTRSWGKFDHQEYAIDDKTVPFTMRHDTIVVKNGETLNHENGIDYTFNVVVTNCEWDVIRGVKIDGGVCHEVKQEITVKVQDVNEPPVILCKDNTDPKCKGPYDVFEHSKKDSVIYTFIVKDEDKVESFTTTVTDKNGTEIKLFSAEVVKNATTGEWELPLVVADDIDYETMDVRYDLTITVTDKGGETSSIKRTIYIVDVNEAPTITGVEDLNDKIKESDKDVYTFYPREDLDAGGSVGYVHTTDPDVLHKDEFGFLTFSIDDQTVPFEMKDSLMVLTKKLDYETDPKVYTFDVVVVNCEREKNSAGKYVVTDRCLAPVTKTVTVKLQDVDEPPIIIPKCEGDDCPTICQGDKCEVCTDVSCHEECVENCDKPYDPVKVLTVSVNEHSPKNYEVMRYLVRDEDYGVGHTKDLTAEIKNTTANTGAADLFAAKMEKDADGNWNVVVYVADSAKLDYEKLSFYTHDVTINVYDPDDGEGVHGSLLRVIKVVDVNEAPTIAGVTDFNKDIKDADKAEFTFYPKESVKTGDSIGFVIATDPDTKHENEFARLEYSVVDPNGDIPFIMKDSLLVVKDASLLNYESAKTEYKFDVQVDNCEWEKSGSKYVKTDRCLAPVTKTVTVKLQDVDEPPIIIPECEGDECVEICKGDKCEICVGESCHEICVENCDSPYGPTKVLNVSVDENSPTGYKVMSYLVSDEDYGFGHTKDLTAKIKNTNNSGADSLFVATMEQQTSGEWRVVVSVIDGTKLDYEKVKETHNVTIYVYDPEDPAGMYDSLLRVIKVVDVNEAPSLVKPVEFDMDENTPVGTVVQKMVASDPDSKNKKFRELKYSIISTDPVPFAMDSNRVKVTELLNYEKSDTTFTFKVKVEDKYDPTLFDIADVTVHVKNVNEDPVIIPDDCEGSDCTDDCIGDKCGDGKDDSPKCIEDCDDVNQKKKEYATIGIEENSKKGTELFRYSVFDEDFGEIGNLSVKAVVLDSTVKNKTALTDLFDLKYDKTKHEIVMTLKDSTKLDYEALRQAKTRNDPDPEYKVAIVVTDPKGLTDTLFRVIRIVDVNELPLFTVWPLVITENNKVPDTLGHVEHPSDIDSLSRNPALYDNYPKMTDGNIDLFDVVQDPDDPMRILLVTDVKLDCESGKVDENGVFKYDYNCGQDSAYWVVLTYGDTTLGPDAIHADQRVPVKLVDLNELPEIKTDTIGVDENSPKGTVVDTIKWFDIDRFDTAMTFKIVNDPIGCFAIDSKTGVVTVKSNKCSGLDYEKNPTIDLKVSITDLVGVPDSLYDDKCKCQLIYTKNGLPNTVEKTIKVYIHDVNEPPSLTDKTITVKEDTKPKTVVDTVRATDPDIVPEYTDLTYTLIGGDTATFKIEPKTGALILKDTLDYEAKSSYYVIVRVDDGEFDDIAKVTINIGNVKEWTKVKITEASTKRKTWDEPDVIYTYEPIREICWNQDGFDTCMTDLNIAKDTVVVVSWKNPVKDYAGRDSVRIYFNNAVPAVSIKADTTLVTADNVFTIVEDMGEADTNIYLNKPKDSIFVVIKDPASKLDTTFKIEVGLEPIESSKVQSTLDKMTKIVDSKIMRDETAKNVVETAINDNQYKYSYNEIVGKDTVKVSYMTDKDGDPIKVPVVNEKGKIDSVEVITVTYKTVINGKQVEVSYQADALTGQVYVKGPAGELMEQGASKKLYGKGKDPNSTKATYDVNEGMFTITTGGKDVLGNDRVISYSVDKKGNMVKNTEGDAGYSVTYSFVNKYGNVATESVFIVVDQVGPVVEILSPINKEVIRSNSVKVVWTVDGIEQDTLTLQGLSKGPNVIVRFYRDKAGNEASDTVYVFMKDSKDVDISVEQPVTEISADKIEEYYAVNPPEKGETFAVSIKNPTTGEEVETLIGGSFKTKEGSGKEPYPGVSGSNHLGPTLAMDIKVPIATAVGGLATLDDIVTSGNMISLKGVDAKESPKITVEQYVEEYCEKDFELPSDLSKVNLYDTKLHAQIWVYTSLGNFVDYFNFTQDLNDPSYTDDAGLLKMYFEMKPDKDGFVKADNGKQYATGAFVYKVQANIRSKARCTVPDQTYGEPGSLADGFSEATKRKGDVIKNSDELLKSFGYRRPQKK